MLRLLGTLPFLTLLLLVAAACESSTREGCIEEVEPSEACMGFCDIAQTCETTDPNVQCEELCQCQIESAYDTSDACGQAWEADTACVAEIDECAGFLDLLAGEEDAPCREEVDLTTELCFDENGLPLN
ncbi:MAG: hypothetical protein AAF436_11380 [Myxococcota bacterium]